MQRNAQGLPYLVSGTSELIQRAMIRLIVRRGSFAPDKSLGSELYLLNSSSNARDMDTAGLNLVRQALLPIPQITVTNVNCLRNADILRLKIQLMVDDQTKNLEVDVN
ncbi:hypothetical protein [Hydrogenoanaerobacterium saccharovorans]|uniref:hypothetical protein n=1 Tax=Hydrogenoanaerobacterium saccharovorans TaxID=474960 RepID=UPI000F4D6E16|nr:hypothetical protein [Hydrogenoanaerobacterium saccharovorans]